MYIAPDHCYNGADGRRWVCYDKFFGAVTISKKDPEEPTSMVFCNWFFQLRTIEGVPGKNPNSDARQVTCDEVGTRLSRIMVTRGQPQLSREPQLQKEFQLASELGSDLLRKRLGRAQVWPVILQVK